MGKRLKSFGESILDDLNVALADLAEFVACYNPENRFKRKET